MKETPKDRALYILSLLLVFFANFILIPAAVFLVVLTFVAIYEKSFMLAVLFFALAIFFVLMNRLIIKVDDQYEAKKKEEMERNKNIEVVADNARIGRLKFSYDSEEGVMKLSGRKLRPFNNDSAFDVISYDSDGKLYFEMNIIEMIYQDEKLLVKNMRYALLEFLKKEGETVRESDNRRIKNKELSISREKDGLFIELTGVYESERGNIEILATKMYGADRYDFSARWALY